MPDSILTAKTIRNERQCQAQGGVPVLPCVSPVAHSQLALDSGSLHLHMKVHRKLEQEIMASVKQTETGAYLTLDPEKTKAIMKSVGNEIAKLENLGKNPIIITSPIVRMYFKRLTEDYYKDLIVVSYNEIESNIELQSVGMVTA